MMLVRLKVVSQLLRSKISRTNSDENNLTLQKDFYSKFWSTCNKVFNVAAKTLPSFTVETCASYFHNTLSQRNIFNRFTLPRWIPRLRKPQSSYCDTAPTYREVANIINKARAKASACPLDQLSCIILKRCPIIRTLLHKIIVECWIRGEIPNCWKRGCTILVHKKGDTMNPENFRPITIQSSWYKIFSTLYKNKLFNFVSKNDYIDVSIQKGFWPGSDGVSEHSELLSHMMKDAKFHKRSLVVVLMDLRKAFGEINHHLIRAALNYYYIPPILIKIFDGIYTNSYITVSNGTKWTNPMKVEKGVLQGDPTSPLIFNLCFNSLMQCLKQPDYQNLGYCWGNNKLQQRNWLQFADDAAITSKSLKGAQGLLNLFEAWCKWAEMDIRLDKCFTFGMMQHDMQYKQFLPSISIIKGTIPPVAIGDNFVYLGKIYNFAMNDHLAKSNLIDKLNFLLLTTSNLKVKPQTKIKIYSQYIPSQINFELRTYNFSGTWICEQLDSMGIKFVREWVEAPISSCIKEWLATPKNMGGMGIPSFKSRSERLSLSKRHSLKTSSNKDINMLWGETAAKHVREESIIACSVDAKSAAKSLSKDQTAKASSHLLGLPYQGLILKTVNELISKNNILLWSSTLETMSSTVFNFARKATQMQLATASNLFRWGRIGNPNCMLCEKSIPQTNKHVLSNCDAPVSLQRYTVRHDKILSGIVSWIGQHCSRDNTLYADIQTSCSRPVTDLFVSLRPDIVVVTPDKAVILELTVCHETNLIKSKQYKQNKYENIAKDATQLIKTKLVCVHTIEVTTLGFISNCSPFFKACNLPDFSVETKINIIKSALIDSFEIYCCRNTPASTSV